MSDDTLILIAKIYLVCMALMSVIAFLLFGIDKRRATRGSNSRIPEKTLWLIALLGGWPGALAGQQLFRHKTVKVSFRIVLWMIVVLHLVGVVYWFYVWSIS